MNMPADSKITAANKINLRPYYLPNVTPNGIVKAERIPTSGRTKDVSLFFKLGSP